MNLIKHGSLLIIICLKANWIFCHVLKIIFQFYFLRKTIKWMGKKGEKLWIVTNTNYNILPYNLGEKKIIIKKNEREGEWKIEEMQTSLPAVSCFTSLVFNFLFKFFPQKVIIFCSCIFFYSNLRGAGQSKGVLFSFISCQNKLLNTFFGDSDLNSER